MAVEQSCSESESDNHTSRDVTPCEPDDIDDLKGSQDDEPLTPSGSRGETLPSSHSILQLLSNPNKKRRGKDLRPRKRRSYKELSREQIQSFRCSYPNCDRKYVGQYGRFNLQRHIKAKHGDQPEIPIQAMMEPASKGFLEPPAGMFAANSGFPSGLGYSSAAMGLRALSQQIPHFDRFGVSTSLASQEFGEGFGISRPSFRHIMGPGNVDDIGFDFLRKPVLPPPHAASKLDSLLPHIEDRELSSPNTGRLKPIDSLLARGGVQDFKPDFQSRNVARAMQPSPNFSLACK